MGQQGGFGLLGILIFVADVWALINIVQSAAPKLHKAVWTVVVLVPALGVVLWYLMGPRRRTA
ncbi:MAG TPA: PLDc N-terminal domain-containing protein [Nevskia sp.]|jgi:hypothetical protein|nr:PLDc N-terminal domain-containing protein [Nevskia sp.]